MSAAALMVETAPTEEEKSKIAADKASNAAVLAAEEARAAALAKANLEAVRVKEQAEKEEVRLLRLPLSSCLASSSKTPHSPNLTLSPHPLVTSSPHRHQTTKAKMAAATSAGEKAAAAKEGAKNKMTKKAGAVKGRKIPKGALDMSDPALEEAWQSVSRDDNDIDWCVWAWHKRHTCMARSVHTRAHDNSTQHKATHSIYDAAGSSCWFDWAAVLAQGALWALQGHVPADGGGDRR